jgi:hypothetical protein
MHGAMIHHPRPVLILGPVLDPRDAASGRSARAEGLFVGLRS